MDEKGSPQLQLPQFFAALSLVYFHYKGNAERAMNVGKQQHHELRPETTGAAVLVVAGGLSSVLKHTHDSGYVLHAGLRIQHSALYQTQKTS